MTNHTVKGSHVVQAAEWIDGKLGAGTFKAKVAHHGAPWTGIIMPGTWYPLEPLLGVIEHAARELRLGVEDITAEIARRNAEADLRGVYKLFVKLASPMYMLSHGQKLWGAYVGFGEATVLENERGRWVAEAKGIPERFLSWALGAWRGFLPAGVAVSGAKDAQLKVVQAPRPLDDGTFGFRVEMTYR